MIFSAKKYINTIPITKLGTAARKNAIMVGTVSQREYCLTAE